MKNLTIVAALVVVVGLALAGAAVSTADHDEQFAGGDTYTHQVETIVVPPDGQLCVYDEGEHVNRLEFQNNRHHNTTIIGGQDAKSTAYLPVLESENILLWSNGDNALVDELASQGGTCVTDVVIRCTIVLHVYHLQTSPELVLDEGLSIEADTPDTIPEPTDDATGKAEECGLGLLEGDGGGGGNVTDNVEGVTDGVDNVTDDVDDQVGNVTGIENVTDADEATEELENITGDVEDIAGDDDSDGPVDRVRNAVDTVVDTVTSVITGDDETNDNETNDSETGLAVDVDAELDDAKNATADDENGANETDSETDAEAEADDGSAGV